MSNVGDSAPSVWHDPQRGGWSVHNVVGRRQHREEIFYNLTGRPLPYHITLRVFGGPAEFTLWDYEDGASDGNPRTYRVPDTTAVGISGTMGEGQFLDLEFEYRSAAGSEPTRSIYWNITLGSLDA